MEKSLECGIMLMLSMITLGSPAAAQKQESVRCSMTESSGGCTSEFLLPDRPFMVIWNKPTSRCEAHGINLNLSAWDIVENDKDAFAGDNSIIYYTLGHWPALNRKTGAVTANGGVPQRGNLTYHLEEARAQILKSTKPGFDGVAVIDMENWRPTFGHNFDALRMYKTVSEDIVRHKYPHLNSSAVELEAAREFDAGARNFMEGTLNLTRDLRPDGHWGFYGFPRYWGGKANDYLAYLWRASRGLFPRIYMQDTSHYAPTKSYIRTQVNETLHVWAKFCTPDTLILPYTLCQNGATSLFSVENLTLAIGLPGQMGAAGVVIWGSSSIFHTPAECQRLQKYVGTVLGPYVKNLTTFLTNCSRQYCSFHGRCVEKSLEMVVQQQRLQNGQKHCLNDKLLMEMGETGYGGEAGAGVGGSPEGAENVSGFPPPYENYVCRCVPGWSGEHCDQRVCDGK